jgi:sterol desaturase/sphingolipid hydroxylase (fatty acid hydroxylase superfamily)
MARPERGLPWWLDVALVGGAFVTLCWLEVRRPLRRTVEPKLRRNVRNVATAALSALAIRLTERPVAHRLAVLVERRRWGLAKWLRLPVWIEVGLAIALLDYTLYLWHVLAHKVPLVWRFHRVHHVDLDLDASTALRFHFGEMILSTPWRAAQVVILGVGPRSLSVWNTLLLIEIMFHHANLALPTEAERRLSRFIVTPRLHGIHHSAVMDETDSNWSSGLTVWDRLHGTLREDVAQESITIGVPAYQDPDDVSLPEILMMPFGWQRPTWTRR